MEISDTIKKVVIIAPHPDDEINLAGTIMDQFLSNNIDIYVIFVTNGDSKREFTNRRIIEAQKIQMFYGIKKIFFLGYGDDYYGKHIYDMAQNGVSESKAGMTRTYCPLEIKEFCYEYRGIHNDYTKKNLVRDLSECLEMINAELVIYSDCDPHPDHVACSLCCDEALSYLIREKNYTPIVLKKFAYEGVWNGEKDYFSRPLSPTIIDNSIEPNCYYGKEDYVRVFVAHSIYPLFFWKSSVYKALRIYKTQFAIMHFRSIVNADSVFFFRDTKNLALKATVSCSSGDSCYINDFKLYDTINARSYIFSDCMWRPSIYDSSPWIRISFDKCSDIKFIRFHIFYDGESYIEKIRVIIRSTEYSIEKCNSSFVINMEINEEKVSELFIVIDEFVGNNWGIREIEVFDKEYSFPWEKVLLNYRAENNKREHCALGKVMGRLYCFVEKVLVKIDMTALKRKNYYSKYR